MTAKEAVDLLIQEEFVVANKAGKLIFTKKYYETFKGIPEGAIVAIAVREKNLTLKPGDVNWDDYYMNFIMEAQVPREGRDSEGRFYNMNNYSKDGMKAFKAAIMAGIKYEGLVACTALYYRSKLAYKLAIGNFMASGAWRTEYLALGQAIQNNTVEELVKQATKDGSKGTTSYRIG